MITNGILLGLMVITGVFIPYWTIPLSTMFISSLLIAKVGMSSILVICLIGGFLGTSVLWLFDEQIHKRLDRYMQHKKPHKREKKTKITIRSQELLNKMEFLENKYFLYIATFCASFSIIPDVVTVELMREKMKSHEFIIAMGLGKTVIYLPLIVGSSGIISYLL